ncbi:MAG TPA: hypothetical protein VNK26_05270, partial [Pyrinomonadaceae bacterium]|nr:hypothetical protein [Pyrinomonadaceae bacterium]
MVIEVDLIIRNIKEVLTCHADEPKRGKALNELNIRRHCAIAIKDGRFLSIKSEKELLDKYSAKEIIDAKGGIILPGFVDPHTHIVYAGNRLDEFEQKISGADYLEILASGGGILSTVKQTREASLDNLTAQSFNRLCKMIQSGTTTCEVKTGYGLSTRDELKMLKVIEKLYQLSKIDIVPTLLAAHAMPKEFASKRESYI